MMDRALLPLNALRAFDAAARHLSFTRAALELCVSQGAVSHQVIALERRLGVRLFRRLPRGLALTDEGQALVPAVSAAFDRIGETLGRVGAGRAREVLHLGVVGTFATGWLLPRLAGFTSDFPHVDLRIATNNNRVDPAGEGLDLAIRFGDGAWHGMRAVPLVAAPLAPLCAPAVAARLHTPRDLAHETLLRSYRRDEWPCWFAAAGIAVPPVHGPVFDTSLAMLAAAESGFGVALAPPAMFGRSIATGALVRPFDVLVDMGRYWLTHALSRTPTRAMADFERWITAASGSVGQRWSVDA